MSATNGHPLRIGLDLVAVGEEAGGIGRYASELIPELVRQDPRAELTVFITRSFPRSVRRSDWASSVRWVEAPFRATPLPLHLPYQQLALPLRRAARRLDVVHGVANGAPLFTTRARRVMTLHDVVWMHHPEVVPNPARRAVMHRMTLAAARRADRILTDSLASRDDLVNTARLDAARIDVAPLGIRSGVLGPPTPAAELRRRFGLWDRRVVLCVAQMRQHKNLCRLIRAVASLGRDDVCLALVGESTGHERALRECAADVAPVDSVRMLGWVSDADLEGLYRTASCLVLPSLSEGFGLPVLEAMARGLPVACSDIPALREVAGDAAVRFDPHDEAAIAAAVGHVLDDRRHAAELAVRGRERCRRHPWERTARHTLDTYRRALNGAPR